MLTPKKRKEKENEYQLDTDKCRCFSIACSVCVCARSCSWKSPPTNEIALMPSSALFFCVWFTCLPIRASSTFFLPWVILDLKIIFTNYKYLLLPILVWTYCYYASLVFCKSKQNLILLGLGVKEEFDFQLLLMLKHYQGICIS